MATGSSPVLTFCPLANPPLRSLLPNRNAAPTMCFLVNARKRERINAPTQTQLNSTSLQSIKTLSTKEPQHYIYFITPLISCLGIISTTLLSVYSKFTWQTEEGGTLHYTEMLATFASSIAAAVAMEFLSKWVHRVLWHDSLWHIHQSHHRPREGCFEFNDVFAVINALPALALLHFGFFHNGLVPGICFGAGVGMTLLGMAYIFVHNGLVHGRFPVGPIADIPYFQKVAAAHQIHHSTKFKGVPYGLFLGRKELEEVGGTAELEEEINRTIRQMKGSFTK